MAEDALIVVDVEGVDEIISRYSNGDKIAEQLLVTAMGQSVDAAIFDARIYPAETQANAPPPPYYIRGTGTQYSTYNRGESQQLDKKWVGTVELMNDGVIGTASNPVTYAPYVHGTAKDPSMQSSYLSVIGWRVLNQIAENVEPRVVKIFEGAAKKFSDYLRGK